MLFQKKKIENIEIQHHIPEDICMYISFYKTYSDFGRTKIFGMYLTFLCCP